MIYGYVEFEEELAVVRCEEEGGQMETVAILAGVDAEAVSALIEQLESGCS